jgi:hypothetical protein
VVRVFASVCCLLAAALGSTPAHAGSLAGVFDDPRFARLGLAPLGPALANTVASTYPVASASASVVYAYDPALDTLERRPGGLGPILGERAETVGRRRFNLGLTYSYVHPTTINGDDLDDLVNRRSVDGQFLFFPVPGGTVLKDGRVTEVLPVRTTVDIDVRAHIVSPSVTYGITADLDVNLTLPIVHTALDLTADTEVPDPRWPTFMLPPGSPLATTDVRSADASSTGVGDLLLRAKYLIRRGAPVDLAAGVGLSLPTGNDDDFQGTGTTRVLPGLIASRTLAGRVELLANAGIDLNADDVDRSIVRWAAGATLTVRDGLALPVVFLGAHELSAQSDPIAVPFFFQIERNDLYDASVGLRWRFADAGVVSANALVPLNREGLRADVVPTAQVEYNF